MQKSRDGLQQPILVRRVTKTCIVMHRGLVVRGARLWWERSPDRNHLRSGEQTTLSVHPAAKRYPTLFRAGESVGGEGRLDEHHPPHAVSSDTNGTLNFHCPYGQSAMGLTFTFTYILCQNLWTIRKELYELVKSETERLL